ncbi:MAG: 1-acyl-sn-glycerol-3-phosphate acyltransferase [Chitinophagaceae bacterium]|nr:1-acyl-sn-glycerol-3-phosphate acyltransferase [Chitinophagaceae bacterium]
MKRTIYQFIFSAWGWKIEGDVATMKAEKKYIAVVAPHTSSWDFIVGVLVRSILQLDIRFIGKKELFTFPLGILMRWMGGYPVDRKKDNNLVETISNIFLEKEEFAIALSPEGTRKKVTSLKTGFWYIAKKANIPIIAVGFDYKTKTILIHSPIMPTDLEENLQIMMRFYKTITGKNKENDLR